MDTCLATIRIARNYDAPAIAELCGQLGYPATRQQIASRLAGIESEPASRVFVAENHEGTVIGWLHVAARTQLTEDACAEILGLVVNESARGGGVGRALIGAAETWARSHGCVHIRVRSRAERERAHRFYERADYARNKVQAVLRKPLA
ncbi:MAG: GNAT family N-acetyltransferase [Rhodanobacteraceae bacterium]